MSRYEHSRVTKRAWWTARALPLSIMADWWRSRLRGTWSRTREGRVSAEGYVCGIQGRAGVINEPRARVVLQRAQIQSFPKNLDRWAVHRSRPQNAVNTMKMESTLSAAPQDTGSDSPDWSHFGSVHKGELTHNTLQTTFATHVLRCHPKSR